MAILKNSMKSESIRFMAVMLGMRAANGVLKTSASALFSHGQTKSYNGAKALSSLIEVSSYNHARKAYFVRWDRLKPAP